jgi:hypothetical protein
VKAFALVKALGLHGLHSGGQVLGEPGVPVHVVAVFMGFKKNTLVDYLAEI